MSDSSAVRSFIFEVNLQLINKLIKEVYHLSQGCGQNVDMLKFQNQENHISLALLREWWVWDMKVGVSIFWDSRNTQKEDMSWKSSKKAQREAATNLLDISELKWLKNFCLILFESNRKKRSVSVLHQFEKRYRCICHSRLKFRFHYISNGRTSFRTNVSEESTVWLIPYKNVKIQEKIEIQSWKVSF